jgi:hypothetical protein
MNEQIDSLETAESLKLAYERLFPATSDAPKASERDSYSLAQPYAGRSVPSFASDNTNSKAPY